MDAQPPRIALDRRLNAGGRIYEFTATCAAEGPLTLGLVGWKTDGEIVTKVTGTVAPDDLPAVSDLIASTLAGLVAMTHPPASRHAAKRRTHRNLGARWTEEDEQRLVTRYRDGATSRS